jgi:hypothetical protein
MGSWDPNAAAVPQGPTGGRPVAPSCQEAC